MTKKELLDKIAAEYSDNYDVIETLEKEINAINRKKLTSKIGVTYLFGVIPTILISFISSKLALHGLIDLSILPIVNGGVALGVSLLFNHLYEKRNGYKSETKEYNLSNDQNELIEREIELGIKKKQLECSNNILRKYYHELEENKDLVVNQHETTVEERKKLNTLKEKMFNAGKRMFINDSLCDYENGKKNELKSAVYGGLVGMVSALSLLFLPHLMMGTILTELPVYAILTTSASLLLGSTIALQNTMINQNIYDKKNRELGSIAIPNQKEPQYLSSYSILSEATKEYYEVLKKCDGVNVDKEIKEEKQQEYETTKEIVKEDVVKLEKKY